MDGDSKSGLAGNNVHILETDPITKVNVTGIGNEVFDSMPIVQCTGLVETIDEGNIILIMSQYTHHPSGKTIHSKNQLESFRCCIFDSSCKHGGKQLILISAFPLHVHNGLFYMDMSKPTGSDLQHYPHCFITSEANVGPFLGG